MPHPEWIWRLKKIPEMPGVNFCVLERSSPIEFLFGTRHRRAIQFLKRNRIRKPDQGKGLRILPSGMRLLKCCGRNDSGREIQDGTQEASSEISGIAGENIFDLKTNERRDFLSCYLHNGSIVSYLRQPQRVSYPRVFSEKVYVF